MAALEAAEVLAADNEAVRTALHQSLDEIAANPSQPRGLRLQAIDRLLGDEDVTAREQYRLRARAIVVRDPDPAIVATLAQRATKEGWKDWTPALVRVWSREGGIPKEEEIKAGASPSFAETGEAAVRGLHPNTLVEELLWQHALDGSEASGVKDSDAVTPLVRRDAWTLLSQLDLDGMKRRAWIAGSGPAPMSEGGKKVLAGLAACLRDWRVLPESGEELRWMLTLQQGTSPRVEAWRAGVGDGLSKLDVGLGADCGQLRLRHLEAIRWAAGNWPEALSKPRDVLARDLRAGLLERRKVARSFGAGQRSQAYREDAGGPDFVELSWGDLLVVSVLDRSMREASVARLLVQQAALDNKDTSSEYGGLFLVTPAKEGVYTPVLYPPRAKDKRGDLMFAAPDDMIRDQDMALAHYHFHAAVHRNSEAAGPSQEDLGYARVWERGCLVFTSVREGVLNVDYYQPSGRSEAGGIRWGGTVLDMGVIGEAGFEGVSK